MESKFFRAEKIYDNVTRIAGLGGEQCYLVEGSEKALLIDGLAGVGSLKAFVRELTDLPVTLVNTHGHVDHIGADFEYGEVYIDPADILQGVVGGGLVKGGKNAGEVTLLPAQEVHEPQPAVQEEEGEG